MQNPYGKGCNCGVQYTDGIVFDEVLHSGKNTIFTTWTGLQVRNAVPQMRQR